MNFQIHLPVQIFSGEKCLEAHRDVLTMGKHAFIVTGKTAARKSGALNDLLPILCRNHISYTVFDRITENPLLTTCFEGGREARAAGADFVIGIGGGSPIDAAKVIAAFATNPDIDMMDVFDADKRVNRALPLIAIPTTAGTGTEANPYGVMTLPDLTHKKSYNSPDGWARYAFLDPRYTATLPPHYSRSTSLDAFAHALESYLSPKSTDFSEMMALYAAKKIWPNLKEVPYIYTPETRRDLMEASCAAGIAISVPGTGFPHPLGYSITLLDGISHGCACALFDGDYIRVNMKTEVGAKKLSSFATAIGSTPGEMAETLPRLSGVDLTFSEEEIVRRVELVCGAKNYANSPYVLSKDEMLQLYREHFLK